MLVHTLVYTEDKSGSNKLYINSGICRFMKNNLRTEGFNTRQHSVVETLQWKSAYLFYCSKTVFLEPFGREAGGRRSAKKRGSR
jgi:hypothetical protein